MNIRFISGLLPVADKLTGIVSYTKQGFWFNKDFIEKY